MTTSPLTDTWAEFYQKSIFSWKALINPDASDDSIRAEILPKEGSTVDGRKSGERQYTVQEVKEHWETTSCWIIIRGVVYDVTNFIDKHPGGEEIFMENGGTDVTQSFLEVGHSTDAVFLLQQYRIGTVVQTNSNRFQT